MSQVEDFSQAVCLRLLMKGYTHFVIKEKIDKKEKGRRCRIVIFEAVRETTDKTAIRITQVMDLPDNTITKYLVVQNSTHNIERA